MVGFEVCIQQGVVLCFISYFVYESIYMVILEKCLVLVVKLSKEIFGQIFWVSNGIIQCVFICFVEDGVVVMLLKEVVSVVCLDECQVWQVLDVCLLVESEVVW